MGGSSQRWGRLVQLPWALICCLVPVSGGLVACGKAVSDGPRDDSNGEGPSETSGEPEATGGESSGTVAIDPIYLKAPNADAGDFFGVAVALSADGNTLAIGANREASAAMGIDGEVQDNSLPDAGAVYVYDRSETGWVPSAYLKAAYAAEGQAFGSQLALSADGATLAVGVPFESHDGSGIDSVPSGGVLTDSGAVYVFSKQAETWRQEAYIKAQNADADDLFGNSLALSGDGNLLAVGADEEDGASRGLGGYVSDNTADGAGAVYLFNREGGAWKRGLYVKAGNAEQGDHFGGSVAVSSDGNTLAVGAFWEEGGGVGSTGDPEDNSVDFAGAAYVFSRADGTWREQAYLKASSPGPGAFGSAVSLSADGNVLVVGASAEGSGAMGIDGNASDQSMPFAGAVYVFEREAGSFRQQAYLKASNTGPEDEFGYHLKLSDDASTLLVGAALEDSARSDRAGDETNDRSPDSGAAYLFFRNDGEWKQAALFKAPNADPGDRFGWSLALSGDGNLAAVGANREGSAARGAEGDRADNSAGWAGAVYLYPEISGW